jgi:hypothetical protein
VQTTLQLITNLKLKLVEEVTSQEVALPREKKTSEENGDSEIEEKSVLEQAFLAIQDLIFVCQKIAPGHSRLRGINGTLTLILIIINIEL